MVEPLHNAAFYPNAVTLAGVHDQDAQLAHVRELIAARVPGAWAVKDSFAALHPLRVWEIGR